MLPCLSLVWRRQAGCSAAVKERVESEHVSTSDPWMEPPFHRPPNPPQPPPPKPLSPCRVGSPAGGRVSMKRSDSGKVASRTYQVLIIPGASLPDAAPAPASDYQRRPATSCRWLFWYLCNPMRARAKRRRHTHRQCCLACAIARATALGCGSSGGGNARAVASDAVSSSRLTASHVPVPVPVSALLRRTSVRRKNKLRHWCANPKVLLEAFHHRRALVRRAGAGRGLPAAPLHLLLP